MEEKVSSIESEAGVVASLIKNPDLYFYAEELQSKHFLNDENRTVFTGIVELAKRNIKNVDPYNIVEALNSNEKTAYLAKNISIDQLKEMIQMADVLARTTPEEYKLLANNVLDAAFRRDTISKLDECRALCLDRKQQDLEQKIYGLIDNITTEYSTKNETPQFGDVVDKYWDEIVDRQQEGYSGIPFKFKTLNDYATIEPGELFIFGAGAKQGKSMILLNCAIDLLRKNKSVLYIDSELNDRLFTARVLAHLSGITYRKLVSGQYTEQEKENIVAAKEWMKTKKFTHIYLPMFDQHTIYTTVKKLYHSQGLDVLIIDYFKGSSEGDAFNSYQELGRFVDLVKNKICGDMNIAGLGAVQTTVNNKIADSAKIARNASTIAMIYEKTPEEIQRDGVECGNKKLQIVFNRNGEQHQEGDYIDLRFDGNHILYEEAKQHEVEQPF